MIIGISLGLSTAFLVPVYELKNGYIIISLIVSL
jgi:hypothetical protein